MNKKMIDKRLTMPQSKAGKAAIDKVSVLLPRALGRRVKQVAKKERRALSPQIVMLIEAGLAATEGAVSS